MDPGRMLSIVTANAQEASGDVVGPDLQAIVDQGGEGIRDVGILGAEGPHPA